MAVLTTENKQLVQRVQELEAVHRTIEEAEEHARQAR